MTIFRWRKDQPLPFGLSQGEINSLKALQSEPGWAVFRDLLRDVAEYNGSHLLKCKDHSEIRERQGFINALRYTIDIISTIAAEAERREDDKRRKHERETDGLDRRAFIGSAYYDTARKWFGAARPESDA